MPIARPLVVIVSLDSVQHDRISPELTPTLVTMIEEGGWAPNGGRCQLPSVTYPSHATLLTGRLPYAHGVCTGVAGKAHPGVAPGWAGEARVTGVRTLFDYCRAAGLRTAAIFGDHYLWSILNAGVADCSWPPSGCLPVRTARDPFGYATNAATHAHVLAAIHDSGHDFIFAHYNETDAVGHLHGPDSPESRACYSATDALVGELVAALRPQWRRVILLALSDHGMERHPDTRVNLLSDRAVRGIAAETIEEAGCALVRLHDDVDPDEAAVLLASLPGIARVHRGPGSALLLEAHPGVAFGPPSASRQIVGSHGGPTTSQTLAIVAGGHPAVPAIAASIGRRPPHLADWTPTIAGVFGLSIDETDGRDLTMVSPRAAYRAS